MRCTSPRTVGFNSDGKTLCWSPKRYSKEFATFQIPCGKCISCRLENARQTAVRCVHEASMYENNSFITLTYSEENLKSEKLQYLDFQKFTKDLRTKLFQDLLNKIFPNQPQKLQRSLWNTFSKERKKELYEPIRISIYVAGEYGDKKKRPHWHALLFNWRPNDLVLKYTSDRGDQIYSSTILDSLWPHGISELGSITFESAGYCARYASKKLAHGKDGTHNYEPISKRSSKNAIGKKWIEKFWPDVFNHGYIVLPNGTTCGIPRYYEKWLKRYKPAEWTHYITTTKNKIMEGARLKEEKISNEEKLTNLKRSGLKGLQIKRTHAKNRILQQKFDNLQKHLKL